MKKSSPIQTERKQSLQSAPTRGLVPRDTKAIMAELVAKLAEKLDPKPEHMSTEEEDQPDGLRPHLDRLTVGVDLGDRGSCYCILGLQGETLTEGQLRTTKPDITEFFQALPAVRVVIEVGTHSAWVRETVANCGHEVLVAHPCQMAGPKRRHRKMIGLTHRNWRDWDESIRSRCFPSNTAVHLYDKTWHGCGRGRLW
jgi:hypothetical protein